MLPAMAAMIGSLFPQREYHGGGEIFREKATIFEDQFRGEFGELQSGKQFESGSTIRSHVNIARHGEKTRRSHPCLQTHRETSRRNSREFERSIGLERRRESLYRSRLTTAEIDAFRSRWSVSESVYCSSLYADARWT